MKRLFILFLLFFVLCLPATASENEQSPKIIDIDLGDYTSTMTVEETQVLSPSAIYDSTEGFSDSTFTFESSDPTVANVNALGRITALSEGSAVIFVTCSDITVSFDLTVQRIQVIEIDLGEYQKTMAPDETQVLSPTAIYNISNAAADATYTYCSSDEDVAVVNALGRITAISEGRSTITVTCGSCEASFRLHVVTPEVIDLDLGEYQQTMLVDATQVLSPTAIYDDPDTTQTPVFSYESENESVATINALGRITAISPGQTRVSVFCEGLTKYIDITVKPNEVSDLDIDDHEDELEVGKSLALSVTLIPSDLQDKKATFRSSSPEIATVSENGRVTGIAPGKVTITVSCDLAEKTVDLTVKNKTDGITVEEPYVVLKPGDEHEIRAAVAPASAPQALTYSVLDPDIATVSASGVIRAIAPGSTSVLISNGDQKAVVSVIVNKSTENAATDPPKDNTPPTPAESSLQLTKDILSGADGKTFYVYQEDLPIISSEVLLALYGSKKSISVDCGAYNMTVPGSSIKNAENELLTSIHFTEMTDSLTFLLNEGKQLPGSVLLSVTSSGNYRWLYLYNESLEKWQLLNSFKDGVMTLDAAGQYMITTKKLTPSALNWWVVSACTLALLGLSATYIFVKKKYWFW